jgi:hypothetical protein
MPAAEVTRLSTTHQKRTIHETIESNHRWCRSCRAVDWLRLTSRVTRGENAGRTLTHQFIALSVVKVDLAQSGDGFSGRISYPTDKVDALAAWISSAESLTPIQATGGFLR